MMRKSSFVLWFDVAGKEDIGIVGERGAKVGEMARAGFPVASGFVISSQAYFSFVRENNLTGKIDGLLSSAHLERPDSLSQVYMHIRRLIMHGSIPEAMVKDIYFAYRKLSGIFRDASVEVCPSPQLNLLQASFNGHGIKGEANLLLKIKEGWASIFEPRAIVYRHERKVEHFKTGMALIVQKTIIPDYSGVIYTVDTVTNDKTKIVIEAYFKHDPIPVHIEVRKTDLDIMYKNANLKQNLTRKQIIGLATLGKMLEKHYYFPQEIGWSIEKNKIYIVRSIPFSGFKKTVKAMPSEKLQLLLKGDAVSPGIVTGKVRIVMEGLNGNKIEPGDILVAQQTNATHVPAMKKAGAVVTDRGGRSCHAAIVSRELGIPAIIDTGSATRSLINGEIVTVNGLTGEIYKGGLPSAQQGFKSATKIYADIENSGPSAIYAGKNADGIGLLRAESIIAEAGLHPKKLLQNEKGHIYTKRIAEQIGFLCNELAPKPVVYRLSDFETNEYRKMEGGENFETNEKNPIIGYRGSFRHVQDTEVLKLEIEALKTARNRMGYRNIWMIVPFCRTLKELEEVKRIMHIEGVHRSLSFKLWMMVDVPSNVILLDKFIEEGIDGVLIGLDNLTMLLLGVDRANHEVCRAFDSQNPAVLWALEKTIKTCHKYRISSSIYSKESLYPDLLNKLIEWGITSVTVAPENIESTREKIFNIERRLIEGKQYVKN